MFLDWFHRKHKFCLPSENGGFSCIFIRHFQICFQFSSITYCSLRNWTILCVIFSNVMCYVCRSQWPRGLRRKSEAVHLLGLWVRIQPGAWMSICCECCVLSGRFLFDEPITRPKESYRLWCVVVCDLETSWMRRCRTKNTQICHVWRLNV
jgi:hypothetical protein